MNRGHGALWAAIFACAAAFAAWVEFGAAAARRFFWTEAPISESHRTESRFVAAVFPRLTAGEEQYGMSARRFAGALEILRDEGYVSIGLDDVAALYRAGRLLPPKALVIALDRDNPESVELADAILKRLHMRAVVFLDHSRASDRLLHRYNLSPHALAQMARGGAWDFSCFAESAFCDPSRYPVRFVDSRVGFNDQRGRPDALSVMEVRWDLSAEEIAFSIEAAWPREQAFSDDFSGARLGMDWVPERGVISAAHGRMALLPAPKNTGAAVFLSGTEDWRDLSLEFDVWKYRRALWACVREAPDGGVVRVGLQDGYWVIQQKEGAGALPVTLARERLEDLPAKIRIVLKDRFAVVDLDGRMAFGKAVELSTSVERGRVAFEVYDRTPRAAMGELGSVSVQPIGRHWLLIDADGSLGALEPDAAEQLRQQSVFSRALSPHWLSIDEQGGVRRVGHDLDFVRQLAGYNRCLLVPTAFLSSSRLALVDDQAAAKRLLEGLVSAADELRGEGLNLRIPGALARREDALRFVAELAARLHERGKGLWVTLDGPTDPPGRWISTVDGILQPGGRPMPGVERLDFYGRGST